jgi:hypothetical protein
MAGGRPPRVLGAGRRRPMVPVSYFSFSSEHWVPNFEQTESTAFTISCRSALGSFPFSSVIVSRLLPFCLVKFPQFRSPSL